MKHAVEDGRVTSESAATRESEDAAFDNVTMLKLYTRSNEALNNELNDGDRSARKTGEHFPSSLTAALLLPAPSILAILAEWDILPAKGGCE